MKIWGNKCTHTFTLLVKAYIDATFLEDNLVITISRKIYIFISFDLPVIILGSYSLQALTPHKSVYNVNLCVVHSSEIFEVIQVAISRGLVYIPKMKCPVLAEKNEVDLYVLILKHI